MKQDNNLISIEIARAFAALGVFFYHQNIGYLLVKHTGLKFFELFDFFGSYLAVPLFFLISGFCIHLSNLKYISLNQNLPLVAYYKKRFLRIYPPYFAALITAVALNSIANFRHFPSLINITVHLLCFQGFTLKYFFAINIVLWSISVEVALYIIYPLFFYLRKTYSLTTAMLVASIISIISIGYCFVNKSYTLPQYYCFTNIWFAWCCGAFLADNLYLSAKQPNKKLFLTIYVIIFIAFVEYLSLPIYYISSIGLVDYQLKVIVWVGPLLFLISKEQWLKKQNSAFLIVIRSLGLSSYSLYLLHEPLIIFKNYMLNSYI